MKTYEAIYEPTKNKGVYGISLVENPAMEGTFIALSKENKIELKTIDEEQRILIGLVLEPNKPIYRNQDGEEFNIVFSEATIKELAHAFYKGGFQKNSSLEHDKKIEGVTFVESWTIQDSKMDKSTALGLSYPKGSWMTIMKVDDDDLWDDYVKTEKVKGFSVDAMVSLKEVNLKSHIQMSDNKSITEAIENGFKNFLTFFAKTKEEKAIELGTMKTSDEKVDIQFEGDTLEVGGKVWILAEDKTEVPLPVGEYKLADETILVVTEEGKVGEIKPKATEEPAKQQSAEMTAAQSEEAAKAIENAIKSIMIKYSETMEAKFDAKLSEIKTAYDSKILELSEQPGAKPIVANPRQVELKSTTKSRILETIQNAKTS